MLEDRNRRFRNLPEELREKPMYGQLRRVFSVKIESTSTLVSNDRTFLLGMVWPCKLKVQNIFSGALRYFVTDGRFEAEEIIDVLSIEYLAARVADPTRNLYWFVEKPGASNWMTGADEEPPPDSDDELNQVVHNDR